MLQRLLFKCSISSLTIGLLLTVSSCDKELKLPDINATKKIVLVGEMVAGDSVLIRVGQSMPLTESSGFPEVPEGVQLMLSGPNGQQTVLTGEPTYDTSTLRTIPYSSSHTVKAEAQYVLKATHHSLGTATCTVKIPRPFVAQVIDTSSTVYSGTTVLQVDVRIEDDASEKNYYFVEAVKQTVSIYGFFIYDNNYYDIYTYQALYDSLVGAGIPFTSEIDTSYSDYYTRIPIYTSDVTTENLKFGNSISSYSRILMADHSFNGGNYRLTVFLDKSQLLRNGEPSSRLLVRVKSATKEYYHYLRSYEQRNSELGFLSGGQPIKIDGNVENGLGVVGGVYLQQFGYFFDNSLF